MRWDKHKTYKNKAVRSPSLRLNIKSALSRQILLTIPRPALTPSEEIDKKPRPKSEPPYWYTMDHNRYEAFHMADSLRPDAISNSGERQSLASHDDSPGKPSPRKYKHTNRRPWHWILRTGWTFEVCSSIFSLYCTVAIMIVLANIDGQLLSSWAIPISPNAVLSVLSTASRASLVLPVTESISQLKWLHLAGRPER